MVVSSPQHGEKRGCFFHFSVDGLYGWRILLVIPLEFWEIKHQPFPMAEPYFLGCVTENGWCLFPWSSKGINNKMPQPWSPPRGKLEKRLYFYRAVGDETAAYYDRAFFFRLCHRIKLFHLHSMVKREAVSFIFPLIGSMVGGFYWLFRWNFEK